MAAGIGTTPNNSIVYSGDGSNWSNINGGFSNSIANKVVYGNGLWVAVGSSSDSNNTIIYSGDGSNWSNTNGGFDGVNSNNSLIYSNNLWVAVGYDVSESFKILYSTNGSNWSSAISEETLGVFNTKYSIAYGNGIWMATLNTFDNKNIQTSSNGSNWSIYPKTYMGGAGGSGGAGIGPPGSYLIQGPNGYDGGLYSVDGSIVAPNKFTRPGGGIYGGAASISPFVGGGGMGGGASGGWGAPYTTPEINGGFGGGGGGAIDAQAPGLGGEALITFEWM
jgi:hypothetical protein